MGHVSNSGADVAVDRLGGRAERFIRRSMILAGVVLALGSVAVISTPAFAGTVSGVSVSPSPATAGATSTYTVGFTTVTALSAGGTITVDAPSGTTLPTSAADYSINGSGANVASITGASPNLVITVAGPGIAAGLVSVVIVGVVNPTVAGSTYTFSVATSSDTVATSAHYTIAPGGGTQLTATAGGGQTALVGSSYATPFSVVVRDSFGNAVAGAQVTFAAPSGGAGGTFAGSSTTSLVTTDATGAATSHAFTANATAGTYAVTASVAGAPNTSFELTNYTTPGTPTSVTASGGNLSATVHWVAPTSDGFSAITEYVITVVNTGAQVIAGNVDHATVGGLTNNVTYTFTVTAVNTAGAGPPSAATTPVRPNPTGYWMVGTDGGIFSFGHNGFFGSTGAMHLNAPIVGMASTADGNGYWLVASDGGIFAFGDATFYGSMGAKHLNAPIVGMAATPDGNGYWLVASDGGIFAFGDATYHGSMGGKHLNRPIVGMTPTPSGAGYWLVASDGGIFTFGTAKFFGSTGGMHLNAPIVGLDSPDSGGYWLVATDGGIFAFGDAGFFGSTGGMHLNAPIVGIKATSSGAGYWLVATDGGIFAFGDADFDGSEGGSHLNRPIIGIG